MQCCHLVVWFMVALSCSVLPAAWNMKIAVWLNWSIVFCSCVSSAVYVSSIPRWTQRFSQNTQSGIYIFCFQDLKLSACFIQCMIMTITWFEQALGPGNQPLLPSGMDPTRQPGISNANNSANMTVWSSPPHHLPFVFMKCFLNVYEMLFEWNWQKSSQIYRKCVYRFCKQL